MHRIVAVLVDECDCPVKGSTIESCSECGRPVWIAPSSRGMMTFGVPISCCACVIARHKAEGLPLPEVRISDEQITEALAQGDMSYDDLYRSAEHIRELFK